VLDAVPAQPLPPERSRNLRDGLVLGVAILAAGYTVLNQVSTDGEVDRLGSQVAVLSSQVRGLGGTPAVVPPSDTPQVITVPGVPGRPGADSTVPGPEGKPGAPGADSTVPGPEGKPGADSTVPGPEGQPGQNPPCLDEPDQCRGPKGDRGATGATGPPGPAGTCEPGWHVETVSVGFPPRDARICVADPPPPEGP